jgi:succinate dehydrogenase/fumarate reductase cytochrome b subunit
MTVTTTTWRKLQAASGLVFGLFLVLHWTSHISLLRALDAGNDMLHRVRSIYQRPICEAILFLALGLHFLSNAVIYLRRSKIEQHAATKTKDKKNSTSKSSATAAHIPGYYEQKGHRIAGYMLSVFVFGHVFATRIAPVLFVDEGQYSKYDYAAISLAFDHALPYRLLPKLLIPFAMAANWHLVYGARSALTTLFGRGGHSSVTGTHFPIPLKMVALLLHISIIGSILSLTGTFYEIPDIQKVYPEKYEVWRVAHNGIQSALGLSGIIAASATAEAE